MQTETFHEFEHAGWQQVADIYQRHFGSLTSQTIEPMLDAVDAGATSKLLDIASGPGYVAAAAARRGAEVLGIDFSSAMVTMARKKLPHLSFAEGDAESLDHADGTFDAATMNFGMLHLERPEAALRETYRVLKLGAKFAFSVWGTPNEALGFDIVLKSIKEHGDPSVQLPQGPPFFRFSDTEESTREMQKAGFANVSTRKVSMLWQLDSAEDFFNAFYYGTPRTGGILRAQTEPKLLAIRQAISESLNEFQKNKETLQIPMLALIVAGRKNY